jgi:hypothetical protein
VVSQCNVQLPEAVRRMPRLERLVSAAGGGFAAAPQAQEAPREGAPLSKHTHTHTHMCSHPVTEAHHLHFKLRLMRASAQSTICEL